MMTQEATTPTPDENIAKIEKLADELDHYRKRCLFAEQTLRNYQVLYGELVTTTGVIKAHCEQVGQESPAYTDIKLIIDTLKPFLGGK